MILCRAIFSKQANFRKLLEYVVLWSVPYANRKSQKDKIEYEW